MPQASCLRDQPKHTAETVREKPDCNSLWAKLACMIRSKYISCRSCSSKEKQVVASSMQFKVYVCCCKNDCQIQYVCWCIDDCRIQNQSGGPRWCCQSCIWGCKRLQSESQRFVFGYCLVIIEDSEKLFSIPKIKSESWFTKTSRQQDWSLCFYRSKIYLEEVSYYISVCAIQCDRSGQKPQLLCANEEMNVFVFWLRKVEHAAEAACVRERFASYVRTMTVLLSCFAVWRVRWTSECKTERRACNIWVNVECACRERVCW